MINHDRLKALVSSLYRVAKRLGHKDHLIDHRTNEQNSDYYRQAFEANDDRRKHYTASPYYVLWAVIVDRLRRARARVALEVACGSGQLAWAIADARILSSYLGFDFTPVMIEQARVNCPELRFDVADAYTTELFETYNYDTVVATEFLEHVERDLEVLSSIRAGARFVGTVPNFPYVSHVRHFHDCSEVAARYGAFFDAFSVDAIPANDRGKTFFLLEGIRRGE